MAKKTTERTPQQIELDVRILNTVIEELKRINRIKSPYDFSHKLEYKSTMSIYSIQKGLKPLSKAIKHHIKEKFPEVNWEFLVSGTGEVLKKPEDRNFIPTTAEDNETSALVLKQLIINNQKLDEILAILKNK